MRSSSLVAAALLMVCGTEARAGIVFGVEVANYVIMYEGNAGKTLSVNNFGTPGDRFWTGDIGIAGNGKLAASGPGTLTGSVNFAAANTGQAAISNTTITGGVFYSNSFVQTTMNSLNTLSADWGAVHASGMALAIDTTPNQTVLASSGVSTTVDGVTARLFNVTSVNSQNGENLIIKGDGSQNVIFDVNTPGDAQFHGNILLQDLSGKFFGDTGYHGLNPDQVLFNLYGGAYLMGGDKLDANNNGNDAHPANIITADFLDPNGAISFVNTRITGRIFGGDSVNMQIVSGDTIDLPPAQEVLPVPEPASMAIWSVLGLAGLVYRTRRANRH